ncbi:kinase [Alteromonas australica]|uniref:4-diphosphocytidyl-2-C-methyl-D-erythritol kinase n=1 Tax=Alteromonas australica TaxID=589873 RepID=A0A358DZU4_9ALTE|nr:MULTISPECIES: 4-(cytidine 5'-diphospho)-2-C-methyl-D-erythritol kinase [Alteromonas]MAB92580.1 4-(cytidine 5'-diphospho)-2-C-methyl-D-erythritol kinase [Alteromonas sp.]AJP43580.1 kinase [Alteromonas australica]MAF70859.1 4-(cytidine 5'-diphospho)-2-C-methyl-D-erythritol kinase [Alteromonas sp.]QPL48613.1 4-(cytidine 5'-diphospho)-2-C-methyl-D-erythritol kinase [Alteromonas sp. B31-7]HAI71788.1 4-(cytidine 5'-diphospho)-2-C-methyl-D-erythritol kinase [Alteromonas australica]|tara:strand:- start:43 stop:933 length:891 start_codon:yes stop_codon:yes gene_type:complete
MDITVTVNKDWWPSPAKLNLFLHILGRYDNGYHKLQSLFQMLDYGDKLAFDINHTGTIAMSTPLKGVKDEDNLIIRAAKLLAAQTKTKLGAHISLEKCLPMGGGIGGGSSNAATTLVALNALWGTRLSVHQLADIGLQLGADVPIFVRGETAFAEGVGEQITPAPQPEQWFLVANPNVHISTGEIFTAQELTRNTPSMDWADYKFEETRNDCQQLVVNRYPEVAKLLQWLVHYAPSRMTGTGACVFAPFSDESLANDVQGKLPSSWQSFVAKGVNRSPLLEKLEKYNSVNATSDTN